MKSYNTTEKYYADLIFITMIMAVSLFILIFHFNKVILTDV